MKLFLRDLNGGTVDLDANPVDILAIKEIAISPEHAISNNDVTCYVKDSMAVLREYVFQTQSNRK